MNELERMELNYHQVCLERDNIKATVLADIADSVKPMLSDVPDNVPSCETVLEEVLYTRLVMLKKLLQEKGVEIS